MAYFILVALLVGLVNGAPPLESYNIEPGSVTVSGISAGGAFSTQMHVAYSSTIKAMASFAGVVYYCARGIAATGLYCMSTPGLIDVSDLINKVYDYQSSNDVDSSNNLIGSRVFIYQGTNDDTVKPGNADNFNEFYSHFGSTIGQMTTIYAGHGQPTLDYGVPCPNSEDPYINDCDYDGAYEALNWMYNGLTRPSAGATPTGQLLEYDQEEFYPGIGFSSLDPDGGYVYVPTACASGTQCKLHVVFHGCEQGRENMTPPDLFPTKTGYLEVADANNIVMLFPQIESSVINPTNPYGCFDWWGYDGLKYATKSGNQMQAIMGMINRAMGN